MTPAAYETIGPARSPEAVSNTREVSMGPTRRDWLFTAFVALAGVQGLLLLLRRTEAPLPFSERAFNALRLIVLVLNVAALAAWAIWGPNEGEDREARKPPHDP